MLSRCATASLLFVVGLGCQGASKSDPAPARATASAAAATGSAARDASLADASPLATTAAASAAQPDESPPAPRDKPPDDVLLVVSGLPDRARIIANRTGPSLDSVIGHATGAAIVLHRKPGIFDLTQTFCPIHILDLARGDCAKPAPAEAPLY